MKAGAAKNGREAPLSDDVWESDVDVEVAMK